MKISQVKFFLFDTIKGELKTDEAITNYINDWLKLNKITTEKDITIEVGEGFVSVIIQFLKIIKQV